MKKFLILLLTLIMTVCSAFAVACGGDVNIDGNINISGGNDNSNNGGNDDGNTDGGNDDTDGKDDEEGEDDSGSETPSGPINYEVTQAQYNQAIDISGVKFQATFTAQSAQVGGEFDAGTVELTYTPTKIMVNQTVEGQRMTMYFEIDGSDCYQYVPLGNGYYKTATEKSNVDMFLSTYIPALMLSSDDAPSFEDFTYNAESKAYVYSMSEEGMTGSFKLYFENTKVVKMESSVSQAGEGAMNMTVTYTYNNVDVTLPNVSGNVPGVGGGDNEGGVVKPEGPGESKPEEDKPVVDEGVVEGGEENCEHVWETVSLNQGIMTSACGKCKATKTQDKTQLYSFVANSIFTSIEDLASGTVSSNGLYSVKIDDSEYEWVDASWSQHGIQVKGVVSFVFMLSKMMANPDFNITNAPVKFTFSYDGLDETGSAILMYTFDEENDKVTMYWDVISNMHGKETKIFLFIDVDYDFDTYTLNGFELETAQSMQSMSMAIGFSYDKEQFKFTVDPNFINKVNATASVLQAHESEIIDLGVDFTKEYTEMMDYMNADQGGNEEENPGYNPGGDFEVGTEDWFNTALCVDKWPVRLKITQTVYNKDAETGKTATVTSVSDVVMREGNILDIQQVGNMSIFKCYLNVEGRIYLYNSADGKNWIAVPQNDQMPSYDMLYDMTMQMYVPFQLIRSSGFSFVDFVEQDGAYVLREGVDGAISNVKFTFDGQLLASMSYSTVMEGNIPTDFLVEYDFKNVEYDVELPVPEDSGDNNENPSNPEVGNYEDVYMFQSVITNGETYFIGDEYEGQIMTENWAILELYSTGEIYFTFGDTHYEGKWQQAGDMIEFYYVKEGYETLGTFSYDAEKNLVVTIDYKTITLKFAYRAGDTVDDGGSEDLPPEGGDVEIIEKQDFKFSFVSITYGGRKYYPGSSILGSVEITENFATFILKQDFSAEMRSDGVVSTGSWRIFAGDVFVTLTDNRATYNFVIKYDIDTNNVNFSVRGFDYEFALPDGVVFDQILGDIPGCQLFTLNKIVSDINEWTVGSEHNGKILTEESAMLYLYQDFTFKFVNPQMSTVYGQWTQNLDGGILLTYDDTETIPLFRDFDNEVVYFSLDNIVTYYLDGLYFGGEEELPPVESTPELNVNMPKVLRVGISPDYYPFGYYEEGKLVGFDVEFAKELAIALGYSLDNVEFVVVGEFETIFTKLCDGEFDVIISAVMKTEPREEVAFSSDSYVSFQATYENEVGETVTENEDYVVYGTSFFVIDCINGAIQTLNEKGIIDELAAKWLK